MPKYSPEDVTNLILPELPQEVSFYSNGELAATLLITDITYEFKPVFDGKYSLFIYYSGKKVFNAKGEGIAMPEPIGYKLLDDGGNIIASGKHYSDFIALGETFKNKMNVISKLEPGEYYLTLTDSDREGIR